MKSIKPGRAPSFMGGIVSIAAAVFGVIWMIIAVYIGAGAFSLVGLVVVFIAIVQAVYNFRNATSKNRYSAFDITEDGEEPDPLDGRFGGAGEPRRESGGSRFCPYCGAKVKGDYKYCNSCGRELP